MENPSQTNGYLKDETEELGPSPYTRAYPATYPAPAPPPSGTPRRSRTAGTPRRGVKLQRVWIVVYSNLSLSTCSCGCHFHLIFSIKLLAFHWNGCIMSKTKILNVRHTFWHTLPLCCHCTTKVVKPCLEWQCNGCCISKIVISSIQVNITQMQEKCIESLSLKWVLNLFILNLCKWLNNAQNCAYSHVLACSGDSTVYLAWGVCYSLHVYMYCKLLQCL